MAAESVPVCELEMEEVDLYPEKKKKQDEDAVAGKKTDSPATPKESRIRRLARLGGQHKWRLVAGALSAFIVIASITFGVVFSHQTGGRAEDATGDLNATTSKPGVNGSVEDDLEGGNATSLDGGLADLTATLMTPPGSTPVRTKTQ